MVPRSFVRGVFECLAIIAITSLSPLVAGAVAAVLCLFGRSYLLASASLLAIGAVIATYNPALSFYSDQIELTKVSLDFVSALLILKSILDGRSRPSKRVFFFLIFITAGAAISFVSADSVIYSAERFASAILVLAQVIFLYERISQSDQEKFQSWFSGILVAYLLVGFAAFPMGHGFEINGTDFQGFTVHPQTYGLLAAATWVVFTAQTNNVLLRALAFSICFAVAEVSKTRTAEIAILAAASVLIVSSMGNRALGLRPTILLSLIVGSIPLLVTAYLVLSRLDGTWLQLPGIFGPYIKARGFLFVKSIANIAQHPLFGIGFGTPSDPRLLIHNFAAIARAEFITAEKGSSYIALVEECGLLGSSCMAVAFAFSLVQFSRRNLFSLSYAVLFVFVNFAEAILFGLGGIGLIFWLAFIALRDLRKPKTFTPAGHRSLSRSILRRDRLYAKAG